MISIIQVHYKTSDLVNNKRYKNFSWKKMILYENARFGRVIMLAEFKLDMNKRGIITANGYQKIISNKT